MNPLFLGLPLGLVPLIWSIFGYLSSLIRTMSLTFVSLDTGHTLPFIHAAGYPTHVHVSVRCALPGGSSACTHAGRQLQYCASGITVQQPQQSKRWASYLQQVLDESQELKTLYREIKFSKINIPISKAATSLQRSSIVHFYAIHNRCVPNPQSGQG